MPKTIKTLLDEATAVFPAINNAPLDVNVTILSKHITNILQDINLNGYKDSLSWLIRYCATYWDTYGHLFD